MDYAPPPLTKEMRETYRKSLPLFERGIRQFSAVLNDIDPDAVRKALEVIPETAISTTIVQVAKSNRPIEEKQDEFAKAYVLLLQLSNSMKIDLSKLVSQHITSHLDSYDQ